MNLPSFTWSRVRVGTVIRGRRVTSVEDSGHGWVTVAFEDGTCVDRLANQEVWS